MSRTQMFVQEVSNNDDSRLCGKTTKDDNQIPAKNGISTINSSHILITGRVSPDYLQVNKLNFGGRVQAYISNGKTNT